MVPAKQIVEAGMDFFHDFTIGLHEIRKMCVRMSASGLSKQINIALSCVRPPQRAVCGCALMPATVIVAAFAMAVAERERA